MAEFGNVVCIAHTRSTSGAVTKVLCSEEYELDLTVEIVTETPKAVAEATLWKAHETVTLVETDIHRVLKKRHRVRQDWIQKPVLTARAV